MAISSLPLDFYREAFERALARGEYPFESRFTNLLKRRPWRQRYEEEVFMVKSEREMLWDQMSVPTTPEQLKEAIGTVFFAVPGPPQAYFEIPSDHDYVTRVVYEVMGYGRRLQPHETLESAGAALIAALWADIVEARKWMDHRWGDHSPTPLFWRRMPEWSIDSEPGSADRRIMVSIRVGIPGLDWSTVYSRVDRNSPEPYKEPATAERRAEIRQCALVDRLYAESVVASERHLNAFHKLVSMRGQVAGALTQLQDSAKFGAGVLSLPTVQEAQRDDLVRMRAGLDKLGG